MGQSLVKNYVHIIFSTKKRVNLIDENIEDELFKYIGGISNQLKCQNLKTGGYKNHVHILSMLDKNIALSKLVEEIKSHSSKWVKTKGKKYKDFYWQGGYAAFSVNPADVERVISYIANQKAHHEKQNFEKELLDHFKKYGMEYDERYLWD